MIDFNSKQVHSFIICLKVDHIHYTSLMNEKCLCKPVFSNDYLWSTEQLFIALKDWLGLRISLFYHNNKPIRSMVPVQLLVVFDNGFACPCDWSQTTLMRENSIAGLHSTSCGSIHVPLVWSEHERIRPRRNVVKVLWYAVKPNYQHTYTHASNKVHESQMREQLINQSSLHTHTMYTQLLYIQSFFSLTGLSLNNPMRLLCIRPQSSNHQFSVTSVGEIVTAIRATRFSLLWSICDCWFPEFKPTHPSSIHSCRLSISLMT